MTNEQKAPYEKQSQDDRARYEKEMEKYKKGQLTTTTSPEEDEDDDDDEEEESD